MKISVSAIFLLLSAVSMIHIPQNTILTSILTDQEHYVLGDQVQITFIVENLGQQSVTLHFRTGQQYDVWATFDGNVVWRWSKDLDFIQEYTSFTLAPGERRTWNVIWKQCSQSGVQLPPGSCQIWGQLLAENIKLDPVHREMRLAVGRI